VNDPHHILVILSPLIYPLDAKNRLGFILL
jgi:hypothetical protein